MSKSKRYYWIKLKTDFFNMDEIDFMMSQKNGAKYVVLYQMLCLLAANKEGRLQHVLGDTLIPYDVHKIQRETKYFSIDTIQIALTLYKKLGLIYIQEDNTITIANYYEMIGSETDSAERMRKNRNKSKYLQKNPKKASHCDKNVTPNVTQKYAQCDTDIEIEKEIDKESLSLSLINTNKKNYTGMPDDLREKINKLNQK